MLKIALFIENRRKSQKISRSEIASALKISPRTYNERLKVDGFNEVELLAAARLLKFDVILLPTEADIFTA